MEVHSYKTAGGKDLIKAYLKKLDAVERADGSIVIDKMKEGRFDELVTFRWRGKIHEVYFYRHNRIFYVIVDGENIYLLHACRKQKNKTEKNDCDIVIMRAKEIGDRLSKNFL